MPGEEREGTREGGAAACENRFFQGSGAGLLRSPRFAPSLGLFGKKREALCVPPSTWIWAHSVCSLPCRWANSLDFRNVRS